jgi:DNA helicase II / ATP-dependent DNA helicase PcrA
MEYSAALNPEQVAAVTAPDGPILVLAAAGTGKTRTLVYRVVRLVESGVDPEHILLLTFTNKAAREMLDRARALAGDRIGGLWGGTFHHLANRLLRRHAGRLDYPRDFTILDRDDSLGLIRDAVRALKLADKTFPKREVLMGLFSAAVNRAVDVETTLRARGDGLEDYAEGILRVHADYEARKRKADAMDFDDLLVNGLRLLENNADLAETYGERFRHVLVDEYQDTNRIQADLVDLLARRHRNLLVVGDDFQSIYGWRGANYRNILSFRERYPDARVYKLETNYRSTPEILEVANACIACNPEQFQKVLRATRDAYAHPGVAKVRDGGEQARFVVEQVRRLTREGYRAGEIAILYRAHFHAMELQMELTRERMPFVITSGARFFEQAHIKDVCSVPRIAVNANDAVAFKRLLGMLPGVGPRTAEKIWQACGGRFDVHDAAARRRVREAVRATARPAWDALDTLFAAYRPEGLDTKLPETVQRFLVAFYKDYAERTFENAASRLDDVQEMILYAAGFATAEAFLSDVALLTNLDAEDEAAGTQTTDTLRLSTIHQAKGLEWPVVILLWATEGMFPSPRALLDDGEGVREERRLFYVAVTRARDELWLCVPELRRGRDNKPTYCMPSRFVSELPRELVREVRPVLL